MPVIGIDEGGAGVAQVYPRRLSIFADELTVLTGNALATGLTVSQHYVTYAYQNAPSNGSELTWSWLIASGTYTLSILGITADSYGITDVYAKLNPAGVYASIATGMDWYSAVQAYNVVKTASVVFVSDGWYTLKTKVNGKNVSSSGYAFLATKIWIKPATD